MIPRSAKILADENIQTEVIAAPYFMKHITQSQTPLPEGWRWKKIGELTNDDIQIFNGLTWTGETFRYIDISSIDTKTKKITQAQITEVAKAPSRAKGILEYSDILVSLVRPNLNAVAMVTDEYMGCIASSGFCVLRSKRNVEPRYLLYYLVSPQFVQTMSAIVQGALYPAINEEDVKNFEIPLPPTLAEQRAIAEGIARRLAEAERVRLAAERGLEAARALAGAVVREAFSFEGVSSNFAS